MLKGWVRCRCWRFSLFFRVGMSKQVSWQPSKSWTLLRWVEEHSALLAIWVKLNNERWHMSYLVFLLKGMVLACERLLSVCRTYLTSWAHLPFTRFLGPCVQGPLAFTNCFDWSQGVWPHVALPFQKLLRRGEKKSDALLPIFFS